MSSSNSTDKKEETKSNLVLVLSVVGGIITLIAFGAASISWGVENVVRNIFIGILIVLFIAKTWGKWKDFNIQKAGVAILITAILALMYAFKVGIDATIAFMGSDQTFLSPVALFVLALMVSYFGKKLTKKPNDESVASFGWFVIPNIVVFGIMAATVTKNGTWLLYGVAVYITIVVSMIALKVLALLEKLMHLYFPSLAFTAVHVFSIGISFDILRKIIVEFISQDIWWCYLAILSGCLIGSWIVTPIRNKILNLP